VKEAITELVGRHVATQRLQLGLSQETVAATAGVSRQALSAIERGAQAPSWTTVYALAEVLRCEVADLLPTIRQVRRRYADLQESL
jgi:DNA-binding XRE family transcriptional regulator